MPACRLHAFDCHAHRIALQAQDSARVCRGPLASRTHGPDTHQQARTVFGGIHAYQRNMYIYDTYMRTHIQSDLLPLLFCATDFRTSV